MIRKLFLVALAMSLPALLAGCAKEPEIDGRKVSTWVSLLRHQDWVIQEEAEDALARLGPKAVPYLKRGLRAKDPTLRRGIVKTLGKIGPGAKKTLPILLSIISREEVPVIRASVLLSLAQIDVKDEQVQAEFQKRLLDVDAEVREAAQAGIDALKPPPEPVEPKLAPKTPDKDSPPAPQVVKYELRDVVRGALDKKRAGVTFGLVAEVVRAERRAAIVWPAIADGKILDDDIVGLIFERQADGGWTYLSEVGPLRGKQAATKLSEALGGADDQKVVRYCGVARAELEGHLNDNGKAFADALAAGKPADAMAAYERLTRAFSFSQAAYNDTLPELLSKGAFSSGWKLNTAGEGQRIACKGTIGGETFKGQLELRPCAGGYAIGGFKQFAGNPKKDQPKKDEKTDP
jgi:hypothetical protein